MTLLPGVSYQWSVMLVVDEQDRAKDVFSAGILRHHPAEAPLSERLAAAPRGHAAEIFAANGRWYDALAAISEVIEGHPDAAVAREHRAALLEQAGLLPAAEFERARARRSFE